MRRTYKVTLAGVTYSLANTGITNAADCNVGGGFTGGASCAQPQGTPTSLTTQVKNITNVLLLFVGIAGVIMLIVGGLMYVFSGGNSDNTRKAKDAILYSVVGIVVALLAFAIVNFVLGRFQ